MPTVGTCVGHIAEWAPSAAVSVGIGDWAELSNSIRRLVDAQVFGPFRGSFEILPASLGEEVVVHGALVLAGHAAGLVR